jgi:hypothetical protein
MHLKTGDIIMTRLLAIDQTSHCSEKDVYKHGAGICDEPEFLQKHNAKLRVSNLTASDEFYGIILTNVNGPKKDDEDYWRYGDCCGETDDVDGAHQRMDAAINRWWSDRRTQRRYP